MATISLDGVPDDAIDGLQRLMEIYFHDGVTLPRVLRSDRGTKNTTIAGIQPFLRHKDTDDMRRNRSFMYGRSMANQAATPASLVFSNYKTRIISE